MRKRIISGICIGVILTIVLVLGGWFLWGALLAVSFIAFFELARALGIHRKDRLFTLPELMGELAVIGLYLGLRFTQDLRCYVAATLLLLLALFFVYVFSFPRVNSREVISTVFCFLYAPCMLSFVYLLRELPFGNYIVWVPFEAWICDTCAFFVGRAVGRHKLTPSLSPRKTIEGAVGGMIGATIAGAIFGLLLGYRVDNFKMVGIFILITAVGSIVTQLGDLVASGIKRDQGIKDFGRIIPGHGGIMDRFDSVILVSPIIYYLAVLMVKLE